MSDFGVSTLSVLVNGSYLMYEGKRVFVQNQVTGNSNSTFVTFFTRAKVGSVNQSTAIAGDTMETTIRRLLFSDSLYGLKSGLQPDDSDCTVKVDAELQLLLLESGLYSAAKLLVTSGQKNSQVFVGGQITSLELSKTLGEIFEEEAFNVYRNLVYVSGANRFLRKLLSVKKFYTIQHTYVPVFVKYTGVYDPFEGKQDLLKSTVMYQTAVQKGREVRYGDALSGYLLTHEEICRAFGMKHFMRFTPNLWYNIFVGLLYPNKAGFPNTLTECFVQPKGLSDISKLKKSYTLHEFDKMLNNLKTRLDTADSDEREDLKNTISVLQQYKVADTLYATCVALHHSIVSLGPTILDDRSDTTVDKIYDYLKEAQLLLIE